MAFRDDVTIYWAQSPRIILVEAPSTEISIQDLVDTCREHEQRSENLQYPHLINAAGKENLGGGVLVGITAELQDAVIAFDPRSSIKSSGTITTTDSSGETLIDSAGSLVSDGVVPGDTIQNVTDNSFSSVVSVLTEGQLTCFVLAGGGDNTFTIGDSYQVVGNIQCEVSGGNLVAIDANGSQIAAVLPTRNTHVVRTSASSATQIEQTDIQYGSYNGGVTLDVTSPNTGTDHPVGTLREPVNNLTDALAIAAERGLPNLYVLTSMTIDDDVSGLVVKGLGSRNNILVTVDAAASTFDTQFIGVTIIGTLNEDCHIQDCIVNNLSFSGEFIEECPLGGTITLTGSGLVQITRCIDSDPMGGTPTLDLASFTGELNIRRYTGGLNIINKTTADTVAVDFDTGRLVVDSSTTAGTYRVRGIGRVEGTVGGTATVIETDLLNRDAIAFSIWEEDFVDHQSSGTFGRLMKTILAKINAALGLS